jgi:two-component system response regulator MprA
MERVAEPPAETASVLVVDDEETLRTLLDVVLRTAGYRVRLAVDGVDALDVVEAFAPDAAVVDVMMPRMDGLELCRHLRARGFSGPILVVTASEERAREATAAGADGLLRKPFRPQELQERVGSLLAGRRAAA